MRGFFFLVFLIVYLLNLIPAFSPPTWMVFSFIGLRYPGANVAALAIVGAVAATLGRATLAKLARVVVRQRFLSRQTRQSIDTIKDRLEGKRKLTFGVFLLYAFSPLPSNYLFLAYGLTTMDLLLIVIPFFIGRSISYSFWGVTSAFLGRRMNGLLLKHPFSYLTTYFVLVQIVLLWLVYLFTRIDWPAALDERKLRWLPKAGPEGQEKRVSRK
ncbi:MAG TPA: hypothetical protein VNJ52_06840 [Patescibacteria group bacterium]|nr:hypothetical protein [Patescibacteria group bacterium]